MLARPTRRRGGFSSVQRDVRPGSGAADDCTFEMKRRRDDVVWSCSARDSSGTGSHAPATTTAAAANSLFYFGLV